MSIYYVFNFKKQIYKRIAVNTLTGIASESGTDDLCFLTFAFLWLQTFL